MEKKTRMTVVPRQKLLALCVAVSAFGTTSFAHPATSADFVSTTPTLIVGITVDGLSTDNIELLEQYFGDSGFRLLLEQGVSLTDVDFGTPMDAAACNALIHTGAAPTVNGVSGEYVYDPAFRRVVPILNKVSPSAADENYSPSQLLASTISDEVAIAGGGLGKVHSIAPDASMAIVAAGHAANSAYWINDVSGKWTTSTYYQDRPTFLQYRNRMQPVADKLDTLQWSPALNVSDYPGLNPLQRTYPFKVRFPYGDNNRYRKYKSSPVVNNEVTDVAIEYIGNLELGKHETPDMVSIAYTVQPYPYGNAGDERMQLLDGYINLDHNLQRLFKAVDEANGLGNTLIFLVGTPVASRSRQDDDKWRLPTGEFSPKKAMSLLNLYLINKFGNGEWVSGFYNNYFYLNPGTLSEHSVDVEEVREAAASFLRKMAGVTYVYTIDDITSRRLHDNAEATSRNTRAEVSGDVRITVAPGWKITDETNPADDSPRLVERSGQSVAPAFLLYPVLRPQRITERIDARAIAPTVASLMKIRPPNGASQSALRLARKGAGNER